MLWGRSFSLVVQDAEGIFIEKLESARMLLSRRFSNFVIISQFLSAILSSNTELVITPVIWANSPGLYDWEDISQCHSVASPTVRNP